MDNYCIDIAECFNDVSFDLEPLFYNLVLSGGSTKGFSHIGALTYLIRNYYLDFNKLKKLYCTSAGTLIGFFVVLGFDIDDIWNFLYKLDLQKIIDPDISNISKYYAVDDCKKIIAILKKILQKKTHYDNIDFITLFNLTGIEFNIFGTNLSDKTFVQFNHILTPMFDVIKAVQISISLPFLFPPVKHNGKLFLDGGFYHNYPIDLVPEEDMDTTIGIYITDNYNIESKNFVDYALSVFKLILHIYNSKYVNVTNTIKIVLDDFTIFEKNITNSKKKLLFDTGFAAAEEFIIHKFNFSY